MIDRYYLAKPMILTTITAKHSAYYLIYKELNFERFSKIFKMLDIPAEPFNHIKHETVISLLMIHFSFVYTNDQTDFFTNIVPGSIIAEDDKIAISASISSLTFVISPYLILALQHLPQVKKSDKIQFNEASTISQTLMAHGVINTVNIKLQDISVDIDRIAAAV